MGKISDYLTMSAGDEWNGITHTDGKKCRAKTQEGCRELPKVSCEYEFVVGGVNSAHERVKTTAMSFVSAVDHARFRGANGNPWHKKDVFVKLVSVDGHPLRENVIIHGNEDLHTRRIADIASRLWYFGKRDDYRTVNARAGSGTVADRHRPDAPDRLGAGGVREEIQEAPGDRHGGRPPNGGDAGVVKYRQDRFSFDAAKGRIREYLDAVAEDVWAESGTGNVVWKWERPKRKRPIDRLPKKRVNAIIAENVSLIKTIGSNMFPKIASRVYRLLMGTYAPNTFIDWLVRNCGVSRARAYLIVTDQVRKARERFKIEDWLNRGIRFAVWRHKEGESDPREYHIRDWDGRSGIRNGKPNGLNGFVFRLDRLPVIDLKTGERGGPASLVGCRCYITGIKE